MPESKSQVLSGPDDPRPLYIQIMEGLRRQILSGQIRDRLTGEIELAQQLGTSRGTVKQAINALVQEGLLHRKRALGTFVNADRIERYYHEISSFTGSMKAQGLSPSVEMLSFERIPADEETAGSLGLSIGDEVFRYERSVCLDGRPVVLTVSHLPVERFQDLMIERPAESLYTILRTKFGATPFRAKDAYSPKNADDLVAGRLGIVPGTAVFHVKRVAFDQNGDAIEYAESWFHNAQVTFSITPMSLFIEEQLSERGASKCQWHHHVQTRY